MAIHVFYGITRKVVPAFIFLSFVGWIVFVVGYVKLRKDWDPEHKEEKHLYPFWAGCVAGPVVYILALIHALLWGFPSAIVGSVNAIFSMFYISAVSAALFLAGDQMTLHDDYPDYDIYDVPDYFKILFAGGFMIIFFWTLVQALWPWYKNEQEGQFSGV